MAVLNIIGAVGHAAAKAVEGYRSPGRFARHDDSRMARSVLECSSPLELFPRMTVRVDRGKPAST